jgi:large conductance mechanosensitive channel
MSMLQEFKKFALRGNVVDMAVGIIIGGAFSTIVKSLVNDVIMPPLGLLTNDVNVKGLAFTLRDANLDAKIPAVVINYGAFLNNVLTFVIVAWAVFMLVKAMNVAETRLRLGETPPADAPPPPEDILLLREIRDELKKA